MFKNDKNLSTGFQKLKLKIIMNKPGNCRADKVIAVKKSLVAHRLIINRTVEPATEPTVNELKYNNVDTNFNDHFTETEPKGSVNRYDRMVSLFEKILHMEKNASTIAELKPDMKVDNLQKPRFLQALITVDQESMCARLTANDEFPSPTTGPSTDPNLTDDPLPIVEKYNFLMTTTQQNDKLKFCKICDLTFTKHEEILQHVATDKQHSKKLKYLLAYFDLL